MAKLLSKLPNTGTTIFTVMSALAKEHRAINLSQGYPDFDCDDVLKELVYKYMKEGFNQYAPMRGIDPLLESITNKVQALYDLQTTPGDEVTVTSGAAEGIYTAITTLVHPGDEVIVIDPAYDLYKPAIELNGGIPVVYELVAPEFQIDWEALGALVTERTKAIVINTPHNPIGRVMSAEDMQALQKLVVERDLFVVSDEVYEHLVFDDQRHESVLRYPELYQRSFVIFSFGKTFHITGWRLGYCVAPPMLTAEFRKVHQFDVFSICTPMQYALAEYLRDESTYLALPRFFQEKRDFLAEKLKNSRLRPLPSKGSYFQLYQYDQISDKMDVDFAREMTIKHGVAAIPITVFYDNPDPASRIIRLCFAKTEETLEKAADRLVKM
ncbi:MAG: aminotransferase class I/II-fold pyridoxal phosphate-dependent enzyme [Saprospiraceae bacterium]|nr:aminotransferase class I/II-fold pyridoxal phosphate-dependent enzyme [Saprospiraceae bacterium]